MIYTTLLTLTLLAQSGGPDPKTDPIAASAAQLYTTVSGNITKALERMPAEKYSFKAVDSVMPFSEFAGHLADSNAYYCGIVTGSPRPASMRKETTKEKLLAGWKTANAECAKAWAMTTDKSLAEMKKVGSADRPAAFPLLLNLSHTWEHYGNIVTYLRMNGLTPPSSDPK